MPRSKASVLENVPDDKRYNERHETTDPSVCDGVHTKQACTGAAHGLLIMQDITRHVGRRTVTYAPTPSCLKPDQGRSHAPVVWSVGRRVQGHHRGAFSVPVLCEILVRHAIWKARDSCCTFRICTRESHKEWTSYAAAQELNTIRYFVLKQWRLPCHGHPERMQSYSTHLWLKDCFKFALARSTLICTCEIN